MTHEPYLEHCPECAQTVRCRPLTIARTGRDGVKAQYRCRICLYSWWTCWQREPAQIGDQR